MRRPTLMYGVTLFAVLLGNTHLRVYECRIGDGAVLGPRELFHKPLKLISGEAVDLEYLKCSAAAIGNEMRTRAGYLMALPMKSERPESLKLFFSHFTALRPPVRTHFLGESRLLICMISTRSCLRWRVPTTG